jgi:hypothetical protein
VRSLIEEELFTAQRNMINPNVKRMDAIMEGLTWALSTNPSQFFQVFSNRRLWIAKTDAYPDAPALRIWYRFDDTTVYLSIEVIEE